MMRVHTVIGVNVHPRFGAILDSTPLPTVKLRG